MKKRLLLTLLPLAFLVAACSGAQEGKQSSSVPSSKADTSSQPADTSDDEGEESSEEQGGGAEDDQRAEDEPVAEGLSVKIGDVYFELDEQDTDPGRLASWNISNLELTAGDVVTLYVDGTATSAWAEADSDKGIYPNYDERPGSSQYEHFTVTNSDIGNIYVHKNDNAAQDYAIWITPNQTDGGSGEGGGEGGGGERPEGAPTTGMAVVVNGETYLPLVNEGAWDMDPSYNQYSYKEGAALEVGDIISFYNADENASWGTMAIDTASHGGLTQESNGLRVGTAGTYDIYIKMKFGQDNIYLGPHLG